MTWSCCQRGCRFALLVLFRFLGNHAGSTLSSTMRAGYLTVPIWLMVHRLVAGHAWLLVHQRIPCQLCTQSGVLRPHGLR